MHHRLSAAFIATSVRQAAREVLGHAVNDQTAFGDKYEEVLHRVFELCGQQSKIVVGSKTTVGDLVIRLIGRHHH